MDLYSNELIMMFGSSHPLDENLCQLCGQAYLFHHGSNCPHELQEEENYDEENYDEENEEENEEELANNEPPTRRWTTTGTATGRITVNTPNLS